MGWIMALLGLGVIILVHEFGHYIVARLFGVKVHEFSIGMGPEIFSTKKNGTLYSVRWLPIGGYVLLKGLDEFEGESEGENESREEDDKDTLSSEEDGDSYKSKSSFAKVMILLAGAIFNFALAWFLFFTVNYFFDERKVPAVLYSPKVGKVLKGSIAEKVGIKSGDLIIRVGSIHITSWGVLKHAVKFYASHEVEIEWIRNGKNYTARVVMEDRLGIAASGEIVPVVGEISEKSGYAKAGLQPQDLILEVNGKRVNSLDELAKFKGKGPFTMKVSRLTATGEKILTVNVDKLEPLYPPLEPIVDPVEGRAACKAGLKKGDILLEINSVPVRCWEYLRFVGKKHRDSTVEVAVLRGDKVLKFKIKLEGDKFGLKMPYYTIYNKVGILEAVKFATEDFKKWLGMMLAWFKRLFEFRVSTRDVSGPVGIFRIMMRTAKESFEDFLTVIAILSLNIGLINLVPFPALDGARALIEMFRGFGLKISEKLEERIHFAGFIVLLGLLGLLVYKDTMDIFRGR